MDDDRDGNEYALSLFDDILQDDGGRVLLEVYNELGAEALSDKAVAILADKLRDAFRAGIPASGQ